MTDPLVWLPFDPDLLDPAPPGLRYEVVVPSGNAMTPPP